MLGYHPQILSVPRSEQFSESVAQGKLWALLLDLEGIFLRQVEAIVFTIFQIFLAARAVFKIGKYPRILPSFSWGIRSHDAFRPIASERKYLMDYNL